MVIPKPGKVDYSKARAYRVISLLDTLGELVERTAAHLIAEQLELKRRLYDGQYGSRARRSSVDAVDMGQERGRRRTDDGHQVGIQQCVTKPPGREDDEA